jgi:hypothetical protein
MRDERAQGVGRRRTVRTSCLVIAGIAVAVIGVLAWAFVSGLRRIPPPWTCPRADAAQLNGLMATALAPSQGGDAAAMQAADAVIAADPDNAMPYYAKARVLAESGNLEASLKALKAGNARPDCYEYVTGSGFARVVDLQRTAMLPTTAVQDLTAMCTPGKSATADAEVLGEANLALREMAEELFAAEPRTMLTAMGACAERAVADKNLEMLYRREGDDEKLSQVRQDRAAYAKWENEFKKAVGERIKESTGLRHTLVLAIARDKAADAQANAEEALVSEYARSWPRPGGAEAAPAPRRSESKP